LGDRQKPAAIGQISAHPDGLRIEPTPNGCYRSTSIVIGFYRQGRHDGEKLKKLVFATCGKI
jgi:hypothetical protein